MKRAKIHKDPVNHRKTENHRLTSQNTGKQKRKVDGAENPAENVLLSRVEEDGEMISSYYNGEDEFEW